jgi:hypothetical protein
MEAHTVVGRRGSHILYTIDSLMVVNLSALRPRPPDTRFSKNLRRLQGPTAAGK